MPSGDEVVAYRRRPGGLSLTAERHDARRKAVAGGCMPLWDKKNPLFEGMMLFVWQTPRKSIKDSQSEYSHDGTE